ncbi:hypothetical protein MKW98_008736 [Papaver atlanticum]|uniref:Uncharacterized protein n=1 Tax=Papaver atlanticum TaxID=357466 RepID=A0AAD4XX22_9MAGN|nr:hypothetical protein MKW98_008736 [Papaver atlanticum]
MSATSSASLMILFAADPTHSTNRLQVYNEEKDKGAEDYVDERVRNSRRNREVGIKGLVDIRRWRYFSNLLGPLRVIAGP